MKKAKARTSGRSKCDEKVDKVWRAAWWFLLIIILLMSACVAITFWFSKEYAAYYQAEKKFELMAQDYYENYYYPMFVEEHPDDLTEAFKPFVDSGFAPVRLRHMLSRVEEKEANDSARKYFTNATMNCDTDNSTVIYIPHAPFGKTDYTMKKNLICE